MLTKYVEGKTKCLQPNMLAIVLEMWTSGAAHYVSMFAPILSVHTMIYTKILILLSSMESETSQDAYGHWEFLDFMLSAFDRNK